MVTMEEVLLPDELPKQLRRSSFSRSKSRSSSEQSIQSEDLESSASITALAIENGFGGLDCKGFEHIEDADADATKHHEELEPVHLLKRLDNIIDRLIESCNGKPENYSPPVSSDTSIDPVALENRLDSIINRLSQRGPLGRKIYEPCSNSSSVRCSPASNSQITAEVTTPSSSAGSLGNSGYAEKIDSGASPSKKSPFSGKSGRFISVLSLLASPRRLSMQSPGLKCGSPNASPQRGYVHR